MISLKRAYDPASKDDGVRFLVERLWPRGVKKSALRLDAWLKDVAPSTELRQWFSHDPAKWTEFRRRYSAELHAKPEALEPIVNAARRGRVTLVFSSHDTERNNAVVLRTYLASNAGLVYFHLLLARIEKAGWLCSPDAQRATVS